MPSVYAGPWKTNQKTTYANFSGLPMVQEAIAAASIGVVTVNHTNKWIMDGTYFEQFNTIATSVVAPSFSSLANNGLNIGALAAANAKEIEITEGNNLSIKNAFVSQTSPAFFVRATFNVKTVASTTECTVGFRIIQTYDTSPIANYTDYAIIGLSGTTGKLQTQTRVASGAAVVTDTTNTITGGQNFTVQVNVSSTGAVTYLWGDNNGPLIAPTTVAAATMGAVTMVPWIHVKQAAGAFDEVDLVSYACGLL